MQSAGLLLRARTLIPARRPVPCAGPRNIETRRTSGHLDRSGPAFGESSRLPRYGVATGGAGGDGGGAGAAVPETPRRYSSDKLNRLDEAGSATTAGSTDPRAPALASHRQQSAPRPACVSRRSAAASGADPVHRLGARKRVPLSQGAAQCPSPPTRAPHLRLRTRSGHHLSPRTRGPRSGHHLAPRSGERSTRNARRVRGSYPPRPTP